MGAYLILALVAALVPERIFGVDLRSLAKRRFARAIALGCACALVVTFGASTAIHDAMVAAANTTALTTASHLPIDFINKPQERAAPGPADMLLVLAIAQTVLLAAFIAHLDALPRATLRVALVLVSAALAAIALAAHAADSSDPYQYVGLATLGTHAYAPPAVPFSGDLRIINAIWGTPIMPSVYGPVWIAASAAIVAPFATLAAKLVALKVVGIASVIACAACCRRLGQSRFVVAAVACNPELYRGYVTDLHNDIVGVDLILAAVLISRRNAIAAALLALAGCLVKATLLPVALTATAFPAMRSRVAFSAFLIAAIGAVYAADGGLVWKASLADARSYAVAHRPFDTALELILLAIVFASTAWTVFTSRIRPQVVWTFPVFGEFLLPQYLIWGLPVGLSSTPIALWFLISLPLVAFLQDPVMPETAMLRYVTVAFAVAALGTIAVRLRAPVRNSGHEQALLSKHVP